MTYGYLRVSTDKQDENNQKLGVDEKALKMGVAIDEYIIDAGVSGTKEPDKRMLGTLMEKLKPGDMIIASEISRLGRSLYMVMRILEYCMKREVKVITVKDGYELGDNIQSKVLAFAFALSAEIERDMISRRTKEALQKRKRDGIQLGRPKGSLSGSLKLDSRHDEIRSYLEKGISYSAIGRIVGAHRMTVTEYCIRNGLNELHKYGNYPAGKSNLVQKKDEVLMMIDKGLGYNHISTELGVNPSAVERFVVHNKDIFERYVAVQNAIRIKANGGLHISTKHEGRM